MLSSHFLREPNTLSSELDHQSLLVALVAAVKIFLDGTAYKYQGANHSPWINQDINLSTLAIGQRKYELQLQR